MNNDSIFNTYEYVEPDNHPVGGIGSGTELKPVRYYTIQRNRVFYPIAMLWVETGTVEFYDMSDIFERWTDKKKNEVRRRLLRCKEKTEWGCAEPAIPSMHY